MRKFLSWTAMISSCESMSHTDVVMAREKKMYVIYTVHDFYDNFLVKSIKSG